MIEIKKLYKTYKTKQSEVHALNGASLKINSGDIFGIIGFSGAGKSTLIRCINLLEEPDSGDVIINGQSMLLLNKRELRTKREKIGMIFQHFNLLDSRTVFGNIAFPLEIAGHKKEYIEKRVTELLEIVELKDKINAYPSQLSGGQKQRVGIARALANSPEILLCDEATSALDPKTTHSILELLRSINEKFGITVVLITHELDVISHICNNMAVIENGEIVESGTIEEVFQNPKSHTAKDLPLSLLTFKRSVTLWEVTGYEF